MTQRDVTIAVINRILGALCLVIASAIVLLAAPKKSDSTRLQEVLKTYVDDKEAAAAKAASHFGEGKKAATQDGPAMPTAWDATKQEGVSLADIVEYRKKKDARYWQVKKQGLLEDAQTAQSRSRDHADSARDLGIGFSVGASLTLAVLASKVSGTTALMFASFCATIGAIALGFLAYHAVSALIKSAEARSLREQADGM